ncbi:hypothetical protein [Amnibacterium kyonggiense]
MGRPIDASSLAPLLRFSAATNLGSAGRAFRDVPATTRPLLHGFGGREAPSGASLASERDGDRIDWARRWMPATAAGAEALGGGVRGLRIGVSMVLEPKTAVLALLLQEAGAEVDVFAFAAETDDAVAADLAARGIAVHAAALAELVEAAPSDRLTVVDGAVRQEEER